MNIVVANLGPYSLSFRRFDYIFVLAVDLVTKSVVIKHIGLIVCIRSG